MALFIKDEDIEALAPMGEIIEAMETALADHARGAAPFYPRRIGVRAKTSGTKPGYTLTTQVGGSTALKVMAVRLMSNMTTVVRRGERTKAHQEGYNERNWGVTVLFSMETGEMLAVLPQFTMSGLRVGATTGLGAKYLAREDATSVGVFGSSKVARADIKGIAQVRKLKRVKVFSPNAEHRNDFAREISEAIGVDVIAATDPQDVVRGADIVSVSTGSRTPVFDGDWLVPGQYVITTMSTPYPRQSLTAEWKDRYFDPDPLGGLEVDSKTLIRADTIATLCREMILNENQRDILDLIESGQTSWAGIRELGDVIAGMVPGRQSPEDIIVYKSSGGIGLQMAAIGAVVLRNAKKMGIGQEIPGEWFSADVSPWFKKGFSPTQ